MKKLFILLFFVLIIAAIAIIAFLLTFDANKYKPLLTEKIEQAIDKDIKIGNISLSFLPAVRLRLDGISIKARNETWEDSDLRASSIEANIKLLPLLKKDVQIEHIAVRGMDIIVARDSMSISTSKIDEGAGKDLDIGIAAVGALNFLAKSVSIIDSSINYKDIKIGVIKAVLENISLFGPINIDAKLSLFARGAENVDLKAVLYPELETKRPYIKNLDLKINLAKLNLGGALDALGQDDIAEEIIGKEFKGDLVVSSEKIYLDPRRIYESNLYVNLSNVETDLFPVKGGIRDVALKAEIERGDLIMQKLGGLVSRGSFIAKGSIKDILSRQYSSLDIELNDIDITSLFFDISPGRPYLEGKLGAEILSSGKGLTKEKIFNTLKAEGAVKIDEAVLRNMNLLTVALDKLDMLPGLVRKLKSKLPAHYRELFRQNFTAFDPIDLNFNIEGDILSLQETVIESDGFYLVCNGHLKANGDFIINSDLFIAADLSEAFVDAVREFKYLQNKQGMITMPMNIYGKFPDVAVKPDIDYVIQRLAVSKGQELLEDIFKIERRKEPEGAPGTETGPESEQQEGQQEEQQEEISPEEAIIRTIFDIISPPK